MKISLLRSVRYLSFTILLSSAHSQTLPIDDKEKSALLEAAIAAIEAAQDNADREDRTNELEEGREARQKRAAEITEQAIQRTQELIKSGELNEVGAQVLDSLSRTTEKETASDTSGNILGAPPVKAQRKPAEKEGDEIIIEAAGMAGNPGGGEENRIIVFENDVVVTHPRFKLTCDRLDVFYREDNTIERTIATGRMVTINTTNNDGDPVDAKCQLAVYEGDLITLRRSPEIRSPRGLMRATSEKTYMTYDTGKNKFHVHGGPFKIDGKDPLEAEEEVAE